MAMDDIQTVDCFERLHRHLLRHDPGIQKQLAAIGPWRYRTQDASFFITHLVALISGLDERTAEGRRRIRRFIVEIGESHGDNPIPDHLVVREAAEPLHKPLSETQRERLARCVDNLRELTARGRPAGLAFDIEMNRLENLADRVAWVRQFFPCLTALNAWRFLSRIGYPVLVPDRPCQTFLFRLGLLSDVRATQPGQLDAARVGEELARSLKRSELELSIWIQAFTGSLPDISPRVALCRRSPQCKPCPLQPYCSYYRYQRPAAEDTTAPLPVKKWRPKDRPRERLVQYGAHAMEDSELLAIVLRTGAGGLNVIDLARVLLEKFGDLQSIEEATLEELRSIRGIGPMKAVELKAVFELGRRLAYRPFQPGDTFTSSDDVYRSYHGRFSRMKQEEFVLLMLNKKNQVIRDEVISRGGLDMSIVHPREVFKAAIKASSAAVIFVHNHPSGDPTPSHDDYVITRRLHEAGHLLQIEVLDHIIVGDGSYYSFADEEMIEAHDSTEDDDE